MTQSIYLCLEVPSENGPEKEDMAASHADLLRLLTQSRFRAVAGKTGKPLPQSTMTQLTFPEQAVKDGIGETVKSLAEVERDYIVEILSRSGGNRSKAAKMLNINRRTLQRKMARFD